MADPGSPPVHDPAAFLGVPPAELPDPPRVVVLPVPFEATTSYEAGTRLGPQAILAASRQVELYDPERGGEPLFRYGVRTAPPLERQPGEETGAFLERLAGVVEAHARAGSFVLALGGEHTLSAAVGRGLRRALAGETGAAGRGAAGRGAAGGGAAGVRPPGGGLAVVQFDAHADLRASYLGERWSHACAARRLLEEGLEPLVQVGIRSYSAEEGRFLDENPQRVRLISADLVHRDLEGVAAELDGRLRGRPVFLTLDVDALDPAVVPATGTPEPDGLSWREALRLLRAVTGAARVVGMDCVELSPRPGLHHAEFTVAGLLYRLLNQLFA